MMSGKIFDGFEPADRSELERVKLENPWEEVMAAFKASGQDCMSKQYDDPRKFNSDMAKARTEARRAGGVKACQRGMKMYLVRVDE